MKHVLLLIAIFALYSCANTNVNSKDNKISIYRMYEQNGYTFFNGIKNRDTIVFVADTKFIKNCTGSKKVIDATNLKQTSFLKIENDTLCFVYSIRNVNNTMSVTAGKNPPGTSKSHCIYTYSSYPYYINSCEAFK